MKKYIITTALGLMLFLPFAGSSYAQSGGGKGGAIDLNGPSALSMVTLHTVLQQAAPYFGMSSSQLIRSYYVCRCVSVVQIGPKKYSITYGGIGIQILVDTLDGKQIQMPVGN